MLQFLRPEYSYNCFLMVNSLDRILSMSCMAVDQKTIQNWRLINVYKEHGLGK